MTVKHIVMFSIRDEIPKEKIEGMSDMAVLMVKDLKCQGSPCHFPNLAVVVFFFSNDFLVSVPALKEGLLSLPKKLDGFVGFELGEDLKLPGGQNHPSGKNRSISWMACFANVADYETYNDSKEHVDVVNQLIKPIIVPGSRAAIQYEC